MRLPRSKLEYLFAGCLFGLTGLATGCLDGPPATAGTTRLCPDTADGDPLCFQQCADTEALSCTALDGDGAAVAECLKDDMTGEYMMVDADYVPPAGETVCVAFLVELGGCDAEKSDVEIVVAASAEDACYDVNCAILAPGECG